MEVLKMAFRDIKIKGKILLGAMALVLVTAVINFSH